MLQGWPWGCTQPIPVVLARPLTWLKACPALATRDGASTKSQVPGAEPPWERPKRVSLLREAQQPEDRRRLPGGWGAETVGVAWAEVWEESPRVSRSEGFSNGTEGTTKGCSAEAMSQIYVLEKGRQS